jgi:hypothetical protein
MQTFFLCQKQSLHSSSVSYSVSEQSLLSVSDLFILFKTMETGEGKAPQKSEARIPPQRGQVKVCAVKTMVEGVKTAASEAANKVVCAGRGSASTVPLPSSDTSKGNSGT